MRSTAHAVLVSLVLVAAGSSVLAAGTVQVAYVQSEKFADIGYAPRDREDTLQELTKHFELPCRISSPISNYCAH